MTRGRGAHTTHAAGLSLALLLGAGPLAGSVSASPGGEEGTLYASFRAPAPRFGLAGETSADALLVLEEGGGAGVGDPADGGDGAGGRSLSPAAAGFLSGVLPGAGQLAMGQQRGWLYLGIEGAAWFAYFSLRSAGHQSETDYREFADQHWEWTRYRTVTDCPGGGPQNFEEEQAALQDLYDNEKNKFYQEIGDQTVYACGWDTNGNRSDYVGMLDHADQLFRASGVMVGAVLLNHLVSAVDAARSAAGRRRAEGLGSLHWDVRPTAAGPAMSVAMNRNF
jgi:hypothetical protein